MVLNVSAPFFRLIINLVTGFSIHLTILSRNSDMIGNADSIVFLLLTTVILTSFGAEPKGANAIELIICCIVSFDTALSLKFRMERRAERKLDHSSYPTLISGKSKRSLSYENAPIWSDLLLQIAMHWPHSKHMVSLSEIKYTSLFSFNPSILQGHTSMHNLHFIQVS